MNEFLLIWIFSLILFVFSYFERHITSLLCLYLMILSFIMAALRAPSYPDYIEYSKIFHGLREAGWFDRDFFSIHGELGFKIFTKILGVFFEAPIFLMACFAFFSFFLLVVISWKSRLLLPIVWFVYYSNAFLLKDMAGIRYSVASLLVVYGILNFWVYGKRIIGGGFFLFSSFFFQYLSIAPIFLGLFSTWQRKILVLFLSICGCFFLNFNILLDLFGNVGYFKQYAGTVYVMSGEHGPWLAIARSMSLFFLIFFYSSSLRRDERYFFSSIFIGCCVYLLFANIPILSQRLGGYFVSVDAFLCAMLLSRRPKLGGWFLVLIYGAIMFFYNVTSRDHLVEGYYHVYD